MVFLPPYTPELQPAEHLWEIVNEPIVNKYIPDLETLEAITAGRSAYLADKRSILKCRTGFRRWPKITNPS